jgi:hypothetical protein
MSYLLHVLHCLDYLHCFGLDPVTTAHPASFDLNIVNILHQTMLYAVLCVTPSERNLRRLVTMEILWANQNYCLISKFKEN